MTSELRKHEWPHVVVDPAVEYGTPTVCGVPVDTIAADVWLRPGLTCTGVAEKHCLPGREHVLVACWYLGGHWPTTGEPADPDGHAQRWRDSWREWADTAGGVMWAGGSPDQVSDPPTRASVAIVAAHGIPQSEGETTHD